VTKHPIIIDPEFRALIPPMSADERAQLKVNIEQHGLLDQIVVWGTSNGFVIIDGHHRYEILKELATDPESEFFEESLEQAKGEQFFDQWVVRQSISEDVRFRSENFDNREAAKLWILEHQVGRRNLTKEQRIKMVARIVLLRQEQSAAISKSNLKKGDAAPDVTKTVPSGKRTVVAAAKEFDVPREPLQAAVNKAKGRPTAPRTKRGHDLDLSDIDFKFLQDFTESIRQARAARPQALKQPQINQQAVVFAKEIIKQGRRVLAEKYHPDKGGSDQVMAMVNVAEQLLTALLDGVAPGRRAA
jgi:hypothetical protein